MRGCLSITVKKKTLRAVYYRNARVYRIVWSVGFCATDSR